MNVDGDLRIELRGARIPVIGWVAHHYFFVVQHAMQCDRWEVWQRPNASAACNGHLHKNLLPPHAGVGWGPSWRVEVWRDSGADALAERIETSMASYPCCENYRYWPGPNSNTYVQWLLGDDYPLPWQAIGRTYARRL